ncbi:MAG: phosphate-starvation-inducible PsiE family protein, partial [Chromatiales bacterium]|jgi:phosphate starvation-inducible membrane PsiE
VIFLLFIAMTAVTRYLAIDLKELDVLEITTLAGCILVLSISVLVLRFSERRYVTGKDAPTTESL